MSISTFARMGVGLLTFVVLARYLGPAQFGVIATAMAYGGLIGLLTDYGLPTYALRQAGREPAETARIVAASLTAKAILCLPVVLVASIAFFLFVDAHGAAPVYALALIGALAASFGDLTLVAARANRRFDREARLMVPVSLFWLAVVGGTAAATHDLFWSALAFMISRVGYLLLAQATVRQWLPVRAIAGLRRADVMDVLRHGRSYAVDGLLTNLSGQIDILLYGVLLTPHDVGIYQAGARLVQSISPFAVIFSTVYLPMLAALVAKGEQDELARQSRRILIEFTVVALLCGLGFLIVGPVLTRTVYGHRYDALLPLWPGLACFVMLRFAMAGYGIQLVALGNIRIRIITQIASLAMFVASALIIVPRYGLQTTSWVLALASALTFAAYGGVLFYTLPSRRTMVASLVTLIATVAVIAAFQVPALSAVL